VRPILAREADIVVGTRNLKDHDEFSRLKKFLQSWGSWVVRQASNTDIPDTTSGFRAYSREAALRAFGPWLFAPATYDERPEFVELIFQNALANPHPQTLTGFLRQGEAILSHDTLERLSAIRRDAGVVTQLEFASARSRTAVGARAHVRTR